MAPDDDVPQPAKERPLGLWSSPYFVAAAVVVSLIAIAGIGLSVSRFVGGGDEDSASPVTHAPVDSEGRPLDEESPESEVTEGGESTCGLITSESSTFTEFPDDTHWEVYVGTTLVPSSTAHGPGVTEDSGFRHCYADSPEGAVLAAVNYLAMANDPATAPDVIEQMLAEGEGKDLSLERLEANGPDESVRAEFQGVRLLSFGYGRARVDTAAQMGAPGQEGIMSIPVDLRWEQGDWRVVTRDDGQMMIPSTVIESADDYVPVGTGG